MNLDKYLPSCEHCPLVRPWLDWPKEELPRATHIVGPGGILVCEIHTESAKHLGWKSRKIMMGDIMAGKIRNDE